MDYRECVQKVLSMVGMMEIQAIDYRGHVRKYVLSMARIMEIQVSCVCAPIDYVDST